MLEREIEIRNQKTGRVLTYFRATYDKVRGGGGAGKSFISRDSLISLKNNAT